jgi:hypothetical protein
MRRRIGVSESGLPAGTTRREWQVAGTSRNGLQAGSALAISSILKTASASKASPGTGSKWDARAALSRPGLETTNVRRRELTRPFWRDGATRPACSPQATEGIYLVTRRRRGTIRAVRFRRGAGTRGKAVQAGTGVRAGSARKDAWLFLEEVYRKR